ncbi:hypothetical protein Rt10032_c01g0440 [Rhodotorula toruloides]|uniref:Uncharacterized protein n=1 Tax=Rhodotorula toruloides TaxID=5286 RepID=A0A511K7U8_RHOTO|nr:hypothetical protein Rt10032_c01g0440 [Rhodotorula toruloides]
MSDLDLTRLLQGHTILSCVAALSDAPVWNPAISIVGLMVVARMDEGASAAETVRQFVAVLGGSIFLDFLWFVSNSTHGLVRVLIMVNWLLKFITIMNALSQLRARGENSFGYQGAGFTLPGGLADRIPGSFPSFGGRQRETGETVWSAQAQQHSYQTRFSLDEEASAGSATPPPPPPPPSSASGKKGAGAGGSESGKTGSRKDPVAPLPATPAEGGGYHTLE